MQKAYPSYEELDLFVSEAVDENLADITGDRRLSIAVGSLLQWAQKKPGKLDKLFESFCEDHPNHPDIPLIGHRTVASDSKSVGERPFSSFIADFRDQLIQRKQIHDLSRNSEFSEFYFIGYQAVPSAIDFIGLVEADGLSERQIVDLRDQFFEAVQTVSYRFGLRPLARNPNGLLAFIFEQGCSSAIASFIQKQSRADSFGKSAVIVSWAIDALDKEVGSIGVPRS